MRVLFCSLALLVALTLTGCDASQGSAPPASGAPTAAPAPAGLGLAAAGSGRVVVANRAAGTVSVINVKNHKVNPTILLPQGEAEPLPEPMYVVYDAPSNRVFVGDRANDRVVAYDAITGAFEGSAHATGIFHMWADPLGGQLWVVDNVNGAMTVIDPATLGVLATVPVSGGVPHDTVLDPTGAFAFVSVFVEGDGGDEVVKYSTSTFTEVDRTTVGEDPHLSLTDANSLLYVPCQGSDAVFVLDRATLAEVTVLSVPGAHGAGMQDDGTRFFTTNLPGGGADGLVAIRTTNPKVLGSIDTVPEDLIPVPHNIALTPGGGEIYVTHSGGTSSKVSIYTASESGMSVEMTDVVDVGLNPFGLAFVPAP